ncbi:MULTISPECIES: YerC/YecD family TrpR-related protein [Clostridium]|jgi:TrpR-related protein YerC/YecD|uniref:Trp operon repressor n=3 Tax=Clostridium intestinale TaxID=36845 RepID=U2Q0J3_9CLOT|nr:MULTISPECIES: YerC/YecD family TrpR-related protein [Clostridium]ERK32290.1 trp operon repressor [Clostridium intestinale URNW]QLY79299.1 helix-turn-helix domain-containing protein [Clostridium intestinale]WRY49953.1 YerC/YecD family TrpR-related protein [Clostridium intestinale]SHI79680.1 Trp operon repressor family [Clostridium intestinale DSM 6191]
MDTYKSNLKSKEMDYLMEAILSLKDKEDCYRFFEDICTINEIKAIDQRIQVARMLKDGKTYTEVAKLTGASTATISRVNKCINYGSDGYNRVISRIDWNED